MSISLSVVIPTYRRGRVLVDTLASLKAFDEPAVEVLVLDQTSAHEAAVAAALGRLDRAGRIRWIRLDKPSIPRAMNRGLIEARHDVVVFLDDDIRPEPGLLHAHYRAMTLKEATLVAGRVIQPWQEGQDFATTAGFHFAATRARFIDEFMGGNFSLRRDAALRLGGFDENFVRAAYNFEAEFAYRLARAGHRIWFEPDACVHHLRVADGGTRAFGHHLTTLKPDHAVGAYYLILRTSSGRARFAPLLKRLVRSILTRHHLAKPWWIPVTLVAQLSALVWALMLALQGPRYAENNPIECGEAGARS